MSQYVLSSSVLSLVLLEYNVSPKQVDVWDENVSVLLRKVSSSPLILRQSNRTQLFCILSGKLFKLCFMQSWISWSRHTSEIWSLSTPPPHQERKEMSNERRYVFHIWMVSLISLMDIIKEKTCKVPSPTHHSVTDS